MSWIGDYVQSFITWTIRPKTPLEKQMREKQTEVATKTENRSDDLSVNDFVDYCHLVHEYEKANANSWFKGCMRRERIAICKDVDRFVRFLKLNDISPEEEIILRHQNPLWKAGKK